MPVDLPLLVPLANASESNLFSTTRKLMSQILEAEYRNAPAFILLFVTLRSNPSSIRAAIVAKNQHQSENLAARSPTRFPNKPILEQRISKSYSMRKSMRT